MRRPTIKNTLLLLFFLAGGITMIVMSLHYFQNDVSGVMWGKAVQNERWYGSCLRAHILLGIVAIILGPFQFIDSLRLKYVKLHRTVGYLYAASVFFSALAGLIVAQFPMGGTVTRVGFTTLALLWLFSLYKAIRSIRKQRITAHRKWMLINYGLTFAAIPQRTLLLLPLFFSVDFMNVYRLSAWLPWILTTLIALQLHRRSLQKIS